jgi:hypothetical protein
MESAVRCTVIAIGRGEVLLGDLPASALNRPVMARIQSCAVDHAPIQADGDHGLWPAAQLAPSMASTVKPSRRAAVASQVDLTGAKSHATKRHRKAD